MAKRRLRRHARAWHLWAMGVGAVISGDFFGWNYGLATGGFGGMLCAVLVMTVLYLGPVSYTHLDVYKRQCDTRPPMLQKLQV